MVESSSNSFSELHLKSKQQGHTFYLSASQVFSECQVIKTNHTPISILKSMELSSNALGLLCQLVNLSVFIPVPRSFN